MDGALPIACTLAPTDLAGRRERWQRLSERALLAKEPIPAGIRLRFRPLDGVDGELRELAALERDCCSFATWSLAGDDGEVVLDVTAAGEGVAAVRELFAG